MRAQVVFGGVRSVAINWHKRLTTQISVFVFVSTLLTASAVAVVAMHGSYEFLLQRVERELPLRLQATAAQVDQWYVQQVSEIQAFVSSGVLKEGVARHASDPEPSTEELAAFLALLLNNSPNFRAMFVVDEQGRIIVGQGDAVGGPGELEDLQVGVAEPAFSGVRGIGNQPSQILAVELGAGAPRSGATFYAVNRLSALQRLISGEQRASEAALLVLDDRGEVVVGSEASASRLSRPEWHRREPGTLAYYRARNGEAFVGSAARLPAMNGLLVIEQSRRSLFYPLVEKLWNTIGLIAVIVLLLCFVAYRIARSIARPVQALTEGAQRMRAGETDLRIPAPRANNELGILTEAFNSMASRLHQKSQEIANINERLCSKNQELNDANDRLYEQSVTDELTQIRNQRFFRQHLELLVIQARRSERPLSLLLIDVDGFKQWNDRFGHAVGDAILRRLAALLQANSRKSDVVARYAGDEFVVLLPDTELSGAKRLAGKLQAAVRKGLAVPEMDGAADRVSVSIGVAELQQDAEQLFLDADNALYASKEKGRDVVTSITEVLSRRSCA